MAAPTLAELRPMLLGNARAPFSSPEWIFEVKVDGFRALAEWDSAGAQLKSRKGVDMTRWFPELVLSLASIGGARCVVDGEICILNDAGIAGDAEFERLMRRAARRGYKPGDDLVTFYVFDLLVLRGRSVMHQPLLERKERLAKLVEGAPQIRVLDHFVADGEGMYNAALQLNLEGVVAKRLLAPYQPGLRSADWLKLKRPGAVPAQRFRR